MIGKKTLLAASFLLTFLWITIGFAAVETIQTGIATARTELEKNNIEQLRERAIRNALDLAVLKVTGAMVNGEKGTSLHTREEVNYEGNKAVENSREQNSYSSSVTSRTNGYAKLVKIIKEWKNDGQYYVTAKVAVSTGKESIAHMNAGYYWRQAGSPSLHLIFKEKHNGIQSVDSGDKTTLRFFKDNLVRNHLEVSESNTPEYLIEINQVLKSSELAEFGTTTMHCRLSFSIIDTYHNATLAEYRSSHGPDPGFTLDQATKKCIGSIAPEVAEKLVRKIAEIMNNRWNNGLKMQVIIDAMPSEVVARAADITQNLFRVTASTPPIYKSGRFIRSLSFKGSITELAQEISQAFADEDWNISVKTVDKGQVRFTWLEEKKR